MIIYTIGFTQKSAEQFFEAIKMNKIEILVDVRLNNKSQLAGFTKGSDLSYFLKEICRTEYIHCVEFAPTKELLADYQKKNITWAQYEKQFDMILELRGDYEKFCSRFINYDRVCLLCSEPDAEHCHRRLVAEKIQSTDSLVSIVHI